VVVSERTAAGNAEDLRWSYLLWPQRRPSGTDI